MAIGSSIVYSVPAVGTTVGTLSKRSSGEYTLSVDYGDVDVPINVSLRRTGINNTNKRSVGLTWRHTPSVLDVASAISKGRVSVSINATGELGSTITEATYLNHIKYALSCLLQSGVLDALVAGSLE